MGMTKDGLPHWQAETEGIHLLEMTIGDLLDHQAGALPTQEAIVYSCYPEFGDALNIRWTYQDYRDRANAVARGLLALGLNKGDHIAVWAPNLPEWPILMMAAAKAGLALQELGVSTRFPFFHVAGIVSSLLAPLYTGSTTYPLLAFDPVKAMQIISSERCLMAGGVSTMIQALLAHPDMVHYDLSALKVVGSGGAPVPISLMEQMKTRLGADVFIVFGQTEGSCCLTTTLADDPFAMKAGTVGKALPHIEIKIIDPGIGEIVPVGERGELCYRGFLVMAGYYQMPEKTA